MEFEVGGAGSIESCLDRRCSCFTLSNCRFAVTALVVRIKLLNEANRVAGISGIKCDGIVEKRGELSFFDG